MWAPLGLIALAAVSMDRRGDNLTLEALDEDLTDTNKGEMILRIVQQKIWKPRWVVGRRWYRTVWSWGDLIVTFILLSANLIWALAHFLKVYYERRPLYGVIYDTDKDMRIGVAYSWAYFLGKITSLTLLAKPPNTEKGCPPFVQPGEE